MPALKQLCELAHLGSIKSALLDSRAKNIFDIEPRTAT